jgi:AraC-like DNA-binding protein
MILQLRKPAFPLHRFIQHLVYFEGIAAPHTLDRFLPDGNTEIIVDLTDRPQYIYDNETLEEIQTCRTAWVSGVRTRPITIPSGTGRRMLVVAFRKGKAFPFYPFPISELTDTVVAADLAFGHRFHDLREQLLAARSIPRMFSLIEGFLLQQAGDAIEADFSTRCIDYAVSSIIGQPALRSLYRLSGQIGYSQKHFIDLFRRQVGVSPKQYLKVMRFQKAICAIEENEVIHWNRIALESGYFDQAHLIHDFKQFSGFTPNEYLRRKTSALNYIPMDYRLSPEPAAS